MTDRSCTRRWTALTLALLAVVLLWDATGLDLAVMRLWGTEQGFALKQHPLLSHWLHRRGQQAAIVFYFFSLAMVWWPIGPWRAVTRRARAHALIAVTLSLLTISALKHFSLSSCPWELENFGGPARYVSHWAWGVADGGGGQCFPGGHASSAFGFLAITLPFLCASEPSLQSTGRRGLLLLTMVGLVFGLAQTLRGAHYPSHTLWTAWICWTTGSVTYHLLAKRWSGAR